MKFKRTTNEATKLAVTNRRGNEQQMKFKRTTNEAAKVAVNNRRGNGQQMKSHRMHNLRGNELQFLRLYWQTKRQQIPQYQSTSGSIVKIRSSNEQNYYPG